MLLKEYLLLARLPVSFILPFVSVTTSYLFASNGTLKPDIIIPISAAIFGTAGMCALNDYFDVEADKLGKKNRPLATGKMALENGLAFAILCTIIGMMIAGVSNKVLLPVVGGLAVIIGLLYNWKTKGMGIWGTVNFGFIQVTMVLLGITQVESNPLNFNYILFLCFVFFIAASNQSVANFYDFESDKKHGYHTIPNIYGLKLGAQIVLTIRLVGFVFLTSFFFNTGMLNVITIFVLFIFLLLVLISHRLLKMAHNTKYAKIAYKISIVLTLLTMCSIVFGIYFII